MSLHLFTYIPLCVVLRDAVRGLVTWNGDATLGDFVIMRSSGLPVYNFCVAVDDYLMNITHVVRAEEHLSNTPKQLLVLEALGCKKPPIYAHCSLILATDRSKLSKRHGATSVSEFAAQGYSQDAMINYLCNLGWNSGLKKEIYLVDELVKLFDLRRIVPSAAVFDMRKLNWVNGQHLHMLPTDKFAESILAQLRGDTGAIPLIKNHISVYKDSHNLITSNTPNPNPDHTPNSTTGTIPVLPPYTGNPINIDNFIDSLVGVLRKDLQIGSDVTRLLNEYSSYPIYDTLTSNDTRPLEVVEDNYKYFLSISKLILRDYKSNNNSDTNNKNMLFFLNSDNDNDNDINSNSDIKSIELVPLWKKYIDNITLDLNENIRNNNDSSGITEISPVTNNIVMMTIRMILTGRTKGPNVAQLLYMLHYCEEFLDFNSNINTNFVSLDERMNILDEIIKTIESSISSSNK